MRFEGRTREFFHLTKLTNLAICTSSGHTFPQLISELAVSSSFTHLNNDISPQAECYTRCQVTHFTVLILFEVIGATGLLTVQITFWEEQ